MREFKCTLCIEKWLLCEKSKFEMFRPQHIKDDEVFSLLNTGWVIQPAVYLSFLLFCFIYLFSFFKFTDSAEHTLAFGCSSYTVKT